MDDQKSIQQRLYPELTCFGCGHANPDGLHLRSYGEGDRVVGSFTPLPAHDNGFLFINGGIITTVLDCHGAAAVLSAADERNWRAATGAPLPFITAGFDVKFLRPTPLGPSVQLNAWPISVDPDKIIVHSELVYEGKVRAQMTADWRRFTPR